MHTILITIAATIAVSFLGILLSWISKQVPSKEGFTDSPVQAKYRTLRLTVAKQTASYCRLSNEMQGRLKTILQQSNNLSSDDADKQVKSTLKTAMKGKEVLPCSIYDLPEYRSDADKEAAVNALLEIPDDIASRISLEVKLYTDTLNTLQGAIDGGMNPPTTAPSAEDMKKIEGFEGKTCSTNALKVKKEMKQKKEKEALEAEAATCSDPNLDAEISRVSSLFEDPGFKSLVASTNAVANKLEQYDVNEKKMKDGTLFPWQQSGSGSGSDSATKKNYVSYSGGDNRIAALTYSMSSTRG
jgi:hypothetical protein